MQSGIAVLPHHARIPATSVSETSPSVNPASQRSAAGVFTRRTVLVLGAALGLLATGCGPTTTQVLHTDSVISHAAVFKMIIVGTSMEDADRIAMEDGLVADLRKRGIDAHPSYEVFAALPSGGDAVHDAILQNGYEAVLRVQVDRIERLVMTDNEHDYIWTKVNIGSSLWDTASDQLVWTAETRTRDPIDEHDLARSVARALLTELTNARLILPVRGGGA